MSVPNPELPAQDATSTRSRRLAGSTNGSSQSSPDRSPPSYGYHNTFHTHATPVIDFSPPSYACATSIRTIDRLNARVEAEVAARNDPLPPYTCSVEIAGTLGLKPELASPFQVSGNREWNDVYVVLQGTQLSIYRIKTPRFLSKSRSPGPGRLLRSFTLQHAEVGIAADFKKTPLTPKSPFAHLVPASARTKLYETDPHLFEPVREHVLRLRLETEQFLLCCNSQEHMLDWVEMLCAAIDISSPLDDRSEPRYRSLPRRSRRQRLLDNPRIAGNLETLTHMEAGRRIIAEQERIIRQLYPHLAATSTTTEQAEPSQASHENETSPPIADAEADDYDSADAHFPISHRRGSSALSGTGSRNGDANTSQGEADEARPSTNASNSSADPKDAPPRRHSPSQALRYRRRCAPVLLASSPRVGEVVYSGGQRMRINVKEQILVDFAFYPPRYDVHNFPKPMKRLSTAPTKTSPPSPTTDRPASPQRGISDDSLTGSLNLSDTEQFGYDLASASSTEQTGRPRLRNDTNEIRFVDPNSEPPSPTSTTQAKTDAARKITSLGKSYNSEEVPRSDGLSAVALGVGLLI